MYYFSCYLDQNHARVTSEFSLDFFPAVYFVISSFFFIHKRPWIRLAAKSHKCERFWGIKFPTHFRMGDERHRFQSFEQKNKNIPGTLLTKILKKELSQGELTFLRGNNLLQSSLKRAWDLIIGKKKESMDSSISSRSSQKKGERHNPSAFTKCHKPCYYGVWQHKPHELLDFWPFSSCKMQNFSGIFLC